MLLFFQVGAAPVQLPTSDPSNIVNQFAQQSFGWLNFMYTPALTLFLILTTIQLAWKFIKVAGETRDMQEAIMGVVHGILVRTFWYMLLIEGPNWLWSIILSFEKIGNLGRVQPITPSSILADGFNVCFTLLTQVNVRSGMMDFFSAAGFFVAALAIATSFVICCIHFVKFKVETYLAVRAAFIFMGFGGSDWTAPYTERQITLVIAAGVRLMVISLLIGLGHTFAVGTWITLAKAAPFTPAGVGLSWIIAAGALIFASICWGAPSFVAGILSGNPALSGHGLINIFSSASSTVLAGANTMATVVTGGGAGMIGMAGRMAIGGASAAIGSAGSGMAHQPSAPRSFGGGSSRQPPAPRP